MESIIVTKIRQRRPYVYAWLGLSEILENLEIEKAKGNDEIMNPRADYVAAFRQVEMQLGMKQTIPKRIR